MRFNYTDGSEFVECAQPDSSGSKRYSPEISFSIKTLLFMRLTKASARIAAARVEYCFENTSFHGPRLRVQIDGFQVASLCWLSRSSSSDVLPM